MNKVIVISITSTAFLIAAIAATFAHNSIQSGKDIWVGADNSSTTVVNNTSIAQQSESSFQSQETAINLNSNELSNPQILNISTTANTQLFGQVTVDGMTIKQLKDNQATVNLSPYLSQGTKTIEISGNYKPASSSVNVEFSGSGTNVSQQIGGNGTLRQTLIITVR